MNQRERMLSGLPYKAWLDGLEEDRQACKQKIYDFNQLPPSRQSKEAPQMIKNIFGKTGENVWVEAPFHCDYGWNIEVGENFYSNYNLTILDVGKVTCGKNVQIAPNVSIYTAGHPVHPDSRNSGYEYGIPVTVGDNVWIGGNTVILPGVTVGSNVVIGAGSVVSKDIPDNTIAAGNPCKVIRGITDEDRIYYFKKQKFDDEAWEEVKNKNDFYGFEEKYESENVKRIIPAKIDNGLKTKINKTSKKIYEIFSDIGVMRVDYLYDLEKEKLYVNEINVIPGALSYYLFEAKDIYFDKLLDDLISEGVRRKNKERELILSFKSDVLNFNKGKK